MTRHSEASDSLFRWFWLSLRCSRRFCSQAFSCTRPGAWLPCGLFRIAQSTSGLLPNIQDMTKSPASPARVCHTKLDRTSNSLPECSDIRCGFAGNSVLTSLVGGFSSSDSSSFSEPTVSAASALAASSSTTSITASSLLRHWSSTSAGEGPNATIAVKVPAMRRGSHFSTSDSCKGGADRRSQVPVSCRMQLKWFSLSTEPTAVSTFLLSSRKLSKRTRRLGGPSNGISQQRADPRLPRKESKSSSGGLCR
mmetsp:Transcript_37385/g.87728  ORF Transcript_37385/g.87728 Transcript_37385/m.87728 type:complete len:252 (-) Transcript_37385:7-762(-)